MKHKAHDATGKPLILNNFYTGYRGGIYQLVEIGDEISIVKKVCSKHGVLIPNASPKRMSNRWMKPTPAPTAKLDDPTGYWRRKLQRIQEHSRTWGKRLVECGACSGSGYYDHNGSPKCGNCEGTGKVREK